METTAHTKITVEILLEGQLGAAWAEWLEGLHISYPTPATTRLYGTVLDQTALLGVLKKIHHLGLVFVSVKRIRGEADDE